MRGRRLAEHDCDVQRQGGAGRGQHRQMEQDLDAEAADPLQQVGIGVAAQQRDLEEGEAGVPYRSLVPAGSK